jgi:hypothetical protein
LILNALKAFCLTFMFLSSVVAVPFSPARSSETVVIKGFEKAEVSDDSIYLGKICTVTGKNAAEIDEIKGIMLGRAPLPGNARRMTRIISASA